MARVLQRFLGPASHMTPGQWSNETASGKPACSCPECGLVQDIEHQVTATGAVLLRWQCEGAGCPMMDWLWLEAFAMEDAA